MLLHGITTTRTIGYLPVILHTALFPPPPPPRPKHTLVSVTSRLSCVICVKSLPLTPSILAQGHLQYASWQADFAAGKDFYTALSAARLDSLIKFTKIFISASLLYGSSIVLYYLHV